MAISKAEPTERLHDDENLAQKGTAAARWLFPEARHDRLRRAGCAGRFHAQRPCRATALDH